MLSDRAGCSGLHVGPLGFDPKIDEKVVEKRDVFQEVFLERLFPKKCGQGAPKVTQSGPRESNWAPMASLFGTILQLFFPSAVLELWWVLWPTPGAPLQPCMLDSGQLWQGV